MKRSRISRREFIKAGTFALGGLTLLKPWEDRRVEKYSHRERLQMILAGEKPDRFAASFWRHHLHMEHHAEGLVEAMLSFQREFDWDFMKINPCTAYQVEGWGVEILWSHHEFTDQQYRGHPIACGDDWAKIEPLSSTSPALSNMLKVVSMLRKKSGEDLPILMTVFTPLSIAGRLVADRSTLAQHLHTHPGLVTRALEAITETFKPFVAELRDAGADGIFYATTQWASSNLITWADYEKFGIPFDLELIKAAGEDAMNLLHVCSSNNFLARLLKYDYRCQMYNWDANDSTNLSLKESFDMLGKKVAVGGVAQTGWLLTDEPDEIGRRIEALKEMADPIRLIIGAGCVLERRTPAANLRAIRERL